MTHIYVQEIEQIRYSIFYPAKMYRLYDFFLYLLIQFLDDENYSEDEQFWPDKRQYHVNGKFKMNLYGKVGMKNKLCIFSI